MQDERLHRIDDVRDRCVTTSRSAKVNTVSRCIAARSFGMPATMTLVGRALLEQPGRDLGDGLARRALAHADDDDAVAGDQHVAALDGGHAPRPAPGSPHHTVEPDEVGMELVDRLHQQRLVVPGRPEQRIERDTAVDPAGGVAGVERVGQRRHQVLGHTGGLPGQCPVPGLDARRAGLASTCRRSAARRAGAAAASPGIPGCRRPGRDRLRWGRSCGPAATPSRRGSAIVSVSTLCSSTTSTSRSRILSMKSKWSRRAFCTHSTSSNSRSSQLVGVSRSCARPGEHTNTLRSLPTSEWTP